MHTSLEDALAGIVAAWDAGDPTAYAAQFTDDATYTTFLGTVSIGREAIRRDHVPVFEKFQKGSRMRMEVTDVRHLTDDIAVVVTEGGAGKGRRLPLDKVQTFVFRRQPDGTWLCEAFHNTKKSRLLPLLVRMSPAAATTSA